MSLIRKAFKSLHYPIDIIAQCVRWYLAYSLSLRNLEEMMASGVSWLTIPHSTGGSFAWFRYRIRHSAHFLISYRFLAKHCLSSLMFYEGVNMLFSVLLQSLSEEFFSTTFCYWSSKCAQQIVSAARRFW